MRFFLVNGYVKFATCMTSEGKALLNKPTDEETIEKLGIVDIEQPSEVIVEAVKDKYFDRYKDAKEYLETLVETVE